MATALDIRAAKAAEALDAWVREVVAWHFSPETGTPFWLEHARGLGFDPRQDVRGYADLARLGPFQDEWLRGGPVRRWVPKGFVGRPVSIFETGGSTGVPKSRINIEDFRIDYTMFSETLPDAFFPKGSDWLQVGPSGPRRTERISGGSGFPGIGPSAVFIATSRASRPGCRAAQPIPIIPPQSWTTRVTRPSMPSDASSASRSSTRVRSV